MKFTQIPTNTFATLQLNAGILLKGATGFNPATGAITTANILGATSGGINVTCVPEYIDFGEDVDNCPNNTMELKRIEEHDGAEEARQLGMQDLRNIRDRQHIPRQDDARCG